MIHKWDAKRYEMGVELTSIIDLLQAKHEQLTTHEEQKLGH